MNFPRIVLLLGSLGFALFGLWGLIDPRAMLKGVGVQAANATGAVELRAMYGGLELGAALALALCALEPERVRLGLWLCVCLYGGLGLARAGATLLTPGADPLMWKLFGAEAVMVVLALAALRSA